MKVHCRSNLDNLQGEKWPDQLPARPMVGDFIMSATDWGGGRRLRLEICGVTWKYGIVNYIGSSNGTVPLNGWYAEVELHMPRHIAAHRSINDWQAWYADFKNPVVTQETES